LAHSNSLRPLDPELGEPNAVFTTERVGELAAEIGVSDAGKIAGLKEELTGISRWNECIYEIFEQNDDPALVRKRLGLLEKKTKELLEQIDHLDHGTKTALAMGFRSCRDLTDPRVRHVDRRVVIGAWQTIGTVRDLVDLLHDAARRGLDGVPRGGGRPSRKSLNQAILNLAQVYEDFTGRAFAREKGKGIWTDSAHWVAKVARMMTPKDAPSPTDSELNTAMRYAASALRD
jgi:hypothetical protein